MQIEMINPGCVLEGPRLLPLSGITRRIVIFLHGYGANGDDLIGIGHHWQNALPDTLFFAPHGPEPCLDAPSGGRQWFGLPSFDQETLINGLKKAAPLVKACVSAECEKASLTAADVALVGFSQGTMLALYVGVSDLYEVGVCYPQAIVGYSGIFIDEGLSREESDVVLPRVLLVHGGKDTVIPAETLMSSVQRLQDRGVSCQWHLSPSLGHNIDDAGLEMGVRFLQSVWSLV
jgi:phospholipase/carboxylesterase